MKRRGIPNEARLVYRGEIFDVYQWDQERFDGSSAVFERAIRPDSAQVIAIQDGRILLAREQQPDTNVRWGLFGGEIEDGEDSLSCAKRELLEETGLASERWEHLMTAELRDRLIWDIPYYIAHDCAHVAAPHQEPGERIEIVPVDFDRFLEIICLPDFRSRELTLHVLKMLRAGKIGELKRRLGV